MKGLSIIVIIGLIFLIVRFLVSMLQHINPSTTLEHDYKTNLNTPFYKFKNLHVKTKALHQVYPQLKVMPDVHMSSNIVTTLEDAAKCSNQLCDILMNETTTRKK